MGTVPAAPVTPGEERVEELPERVRNALGELAGAAKEAGGSGPRAVTRQRERGVAPGRQPDRGVAGVVRRRGKTQGP